ncbi:MAG: hypothetical protein ACRDNS_31950 [Trebonia sp.]
MRHPFGRAPTARRRRPGRRDDDQQKLELIKEDGQRARWSNEPTVRDVRGREWRVRRRRGLPGSPDSSTPAALLILALSIIALILVIAGGGAG